MKNKKNIDSPVVKYRKSHAYIKPDKNCKVCKGKGIGKSSSRRIEACKDCYVGNFSFDSVNKKYTDTGTTNYKPLKIQKSKNKKLKKKGDVNNEYNNI